MALVLFGPARVGAQSVDLEQLVRQIDRLEEQGKTREAAAVAERWAGLVAQRFGDSARTAGALQRWSDLLADDGRHDEAVPIVRRVLAIRERVLGENHRDTAYTLNQLAWSLEREGDYAAAEPYSRRALAVRERVLGNDHAHTAFSAHRLGFNLFRQNKFAEAATMFRLASDRRAMILGDHADTALSLQWLGDANESLGRYPEAEDNYRRALSIRDKVLGRDHEATALSLHQLGYVLEQQNKPAEAADSYRSAIAVRDRVLGPEHSYTATTLQNLGNVLESLRRYDEAIAAYKRALAIREKVLGPENLDTALTLHNLGYTLVQNEKAAEAVPLYERAVAVREKLLGPDHSSTVLTIQLLATAYFHVGRYDAAIAAADRCLEIRQRTLPADHLDFVQCLLARAILHQVKGEFPRAESLVQNALAIQRKHLADDDPALMYPYEFLAYLNEAQARYTSALGFLRRALEVRQKRFGREDLEAVRVLEGVARIQEYLGQYSEAQLAYRNVLAIRERLLGPQDVGAASAMLGLADGYDRQGRKQEAEALYRRSLQIREQNYGPNHILVAICLNRLGRQLEDTGRAAEAESMFRRSLSIIESVVGPEHFFTAVAIGDLARSLDIQGKTAEAEVLFRRTIAIEEKTLGDRHPNVANSLGYLASLLWRLNRGDEAEALRTRALAINTEVHGPDHKSTASSYAELAWLQLARGRWADAARNYQTASDIYIRRSLQNLSSVTAAVAGRAQEGEIGRNSWTFLNHVRAIFWARSTAPDAADDGIERSFELAQWARLSDTSAALSQMSARMRVGSDRLAALVREHQDLTGEWRTIDSQRTLQLSQASAGRQAPATAAVKERIAQIETRLTDIGLELESAFPNYAALSSPRAVPVRELQALLEPDEVLLQYSLSPLDCFVWIVNRDGAQWVRLSIEERRLIDMIALLRRPLGSSESFNLDLAHELYNALFGPIEQHLVGKKLLIVPNGAMTTLPLHVLITDKWQGAHDAPDRYREAAWLVKRQPLTVLPSVSALKALRQQAKRSAASQAFLGVGNPLLQGKSGTDRRAWNYGSCPDFGAPSGVVRQAQRSTDLAAAMQAPTDDISRLFRGDVANVAEVRRLEPLPETTIELCAVAASFGSGERAVLLGAAASETAVKRLSREGHLADVRVLHFATHGLVAGDIKGLAEPALVLTPPADGAAESTLVADDGLLTASEVAQLKLDADWVVLSACNTASGDRQGAEALSGLARAFFYAGARALLVSHWAVDSIAAVKVTTGAFAAMRLDPTIGRAEALRRAMLGLIERGALHEAHPTYWAPFMVVGEGAAGR